MANHIFNDIGYEAYGFKICMTLLFKLFLWLNYSLWTQLLNTYTALLLTSKPAVCETV